MDKGTCYEIGSLMGKIHNLILNKTIERVSDHRQSLLELPYEHLKQFFPEKLPEMQYIKEIERSLKNSNFDNIQNGIMKQKK
jgi:hypothetical protein